MSAQVLLTAALSLVAAGLVVRGVARHAPRAWVLAVGGGLLVLLFAVPFAQYRRVLREPIERLPLAEVAYAQSPACIKCHPDHYDTWHRTYHRTMTQEASSESILGDFENPPSHVGSHEVGFVREGDNFFLELVDRDWEQDIVVNGGDPTAMSAPRTRYRIDRVVGSHEMQVYLSKMDDGTYFTLPIEWNEREGRWVTSAGNYLQPPPEHDSLFTHSAEWNVNCVYCHNTRPNPGLEVRVDSPIKFDTHLEEMGIACEACHGPSQAHIAANENPFRRYFLLLTGRPDRTIANPETLHQAASLEVCGRCHGKWFVRAAHRRKSETVGDPHIPGERPLSLLYYDPLIDSGGEYNDEVTGYFWPDLTPRPTSMEFQGTLLSPCFQRGKMTCGSCHSMHAADPDDQLIHTDDPSTLAWEQNEACIQCHEDMRSESALTAHTHHEVTSTGTVCVSCHMPYQSFGLMKPTQSHRISNPNATISHSTHLPNGCNQCHVDRSLAWVGRYLQEWYGAAPLVLSADEPRARWSEMVVQLAQGHGLSRALAAHQLGWTPMAGEGSVWRVPFLLRALEDDYAAVRFRAEIALRTVHGFEDVTYDYLSPARAEQVAVIWKQWRRSGVGDVAIPEEIPLTEEGEIMELWGALVAERDTTKITVLE